MFNPILKDLLSLCTVWRILLYHRVALGRGDHVEDVVSAEEHEREGDKCSDKVHASIVSLYDSGSCGSTEKPKIIAGSSFSTGLP